MRKIPDDMKEGCVHGELVNTGRFLITKSLSLEYEVKCSCGNLLVMNTGQIRKRKCCDVIKHGIANTKIKRLHKKYVGRHIHGFEVLDVVKGSSFSFLLKCTNCGIEIRRSVSGFLSRKNDICKCLIGKKELRVRATRDIVREKLNYYKDLSGMKFNKLTVIKYTGYTTDKFGLNHAVFLCKCDCGGTWEGEGQRLTSGSRKYCDKEITNIKRSLAVKSNKKKKTKRDKLGIKSTRSFRQQNKMALTVFSQEIYDKYSGVCQCCNKMYPKTLSHAHHLVPISSNTNTAFLKSNGILLCEECHMKFHQEYGFNNFPTKSIFEFIKNYKENG